MYRYIVTEHRQIIVECTAKPSTDEVVRRLALSGDHPEMVVSDTTTRNVYPVTGGPS